MKSQDESSIAWSTFIQRPETLYQTRAIRFRDEYKQPILGALGFEDGMSILEVGCGPGAFCLALERWLPLSKITGLDRDSAFIEYAIRKSAELGSKCRFIAGDATNLSYPEDTFDATTSYTVIEHVETSAFLGEQYRVLRPDGVFTALSVRSSLPANPQWQDRSIEEKALWDKIEPYFKASDEKYGVARHSISETDLAKRMTEAGFHHISINFLVQTNIPDNAGVASTLAKAIIEAGRQTALDAVALSQTTAPGAFSDAEMERLRWLINSRFDERIRAYETGKKLWDISASVLMVARGRK